MDIMFLAEILVLGVITYIVVFVLYSFWKKKKRRSARHNTEEVRKRPPKTTFQPMPTTFDLSENKNNLEKINKRQPKVKVMPTQHIQKSNKLLKEEPVVTQKRDLSADLAKQEQFIQAAQSKRVKKEEAYKRMHRQKVADSLRDMEGFLTLHKDNLPEKWKEMNAQLSIMQRKIQGIKGKQLESKNRNMLLSRIERYKGELVAVGNEIRHQKKHQSISSNEAGIDLNIKKTLPKKRSKLIKNANYHKRKSTQKIRENKKPLLKQKAVSEAKKTDVEFDQRQKQLEQMVSQLKNQIRNN